ncbi:hypothetical protein HYV10_03790 [Candidatus Dependentiae bacterium]|nr:hypothetical protein [Candidatus Dependentiae bacterium]
MNTVQGQLQLIDVYGVWYKPWWNSGWLYSLIVFITTLFLGYFLYRYIKREKKLTPEQEALQGLYRLGNMNYVDEKMIHDAYFKITMIIKTYFILQYKMKFQDKSDLEISAELHGIIPENMISLLKEFFDRSFHIKFAYDVVSESMLRQDIEMLHTLIIELGKQQADSLGKS